MLRIHEALLVIALLSRFSESLRKRSANYTESLRNTKREVYIVVISPATPQDLSSSVSCTHTRKGEGVEGLSRVFYILTTVLEEGDVFYTLVSGRRHLIDPRFSTHWAHPLCFVTVHPRCFVHRVVTLRTDAFSHRKSSALLAGVVRQGRRTPCCFHR